MNKPPMIPELTLSGSPRERGRQHGEELRPQIDAAILRWFDALAPRTNPSEFVAEMLHASGLRAPVETHTPDFFAEVRGIAEGAAQPLETMFAWQLIDECWWYLDELTGDLQPHEACSAMAVNDGTRGIVAQTQDFPRHFDGNQIMLRYIERDGLEILAPSAAGLLAYNGVNSAGIGVCITTLSQLPHRRDGVSAGFVMPTLLRSDSVDAALDWLRAVPLASGNSWTLGTRDRSVVVEACATGVAVCHDGNRAIHTNHVHQLDPVYVCPRLDSSFTRLGELEAAVTPTMTLADATTMYSTGAICQSRSGPASDVSVMTTIVELCDTLKCHVAAGPLDTERLTTYEMTE